MAPIPIKIPSGVVKTSTDLGSQGRWVDADKVRFVKGQPQKLGGWIKYHQTPTPGTPRSILCWQDISGNRFIAVGTTQKVWVFCDRTTAPLNITPARATGTLGANPIATTNLSTSVTITAAAHGLAVGDHVYLSGATAVGGLTISGEYTVVTVPTSGTFTITASGAANATTTGGGAAVTYIFEVPVGYTDTVTLSASQWGSGAWGSGPWDGGSNTSGAGDPRVWSLQLFGSVLTLSYNGGTLYSWTPDPASILRAAAVSGAPATMRSHFITESRFVMALGTTDPLVVQWADQNTLDTWTPTTTNKANSRRLQLGTRLIAGTQIPNLANLLWTDAGVYLHTYTGSTFVFDSQIVARDCGLIGPNAFVVVNSLVYWMGPNGFYLYQGYVEDVPNQDDIWVWLKDRMNASQLFKVTCKYDPDFSEITWFYPSGTSTENDSYITLSLADNSWTPGTMTRSAAGRPSVGDTKPFMTDTSGYLYQHEGVNDGDGQAITSFITASAVEIDDGVEWMDIVGFMPDFLDQAGLVDITLTGYDRIGSGVVEDTETNSCAVGDLLVDFRVRARAVAITLTSNDLGDFWSMGYPKIDAVQNGSRR